MQYSKYLQKIETIICDVIKSAYPRSWVEDTISYQICEQFRSKLASETIEGLSRPFNIQWDAFKLRGTPENLYGDLAIVINFHTWEGEIIRGVSFFEAKKIDFKTDKYTSYDSTQLTKQSSNLKHSNLLLYSHSSITDFEDNLLLQPFVNATRSKLKTAQTHALTVQTDVALQVNKNDRSLYKFGTPFSHQICRNLRGFDLETNHEIIKNVTGWAEDNIGGVNYLLVASVIEGEKPDEIEPQEVNDNKYEHINNGKNA